MFYYFFFILTIIYSAICMLFDMSTRCGRKLVRNSGHITCTLYYCTTAPAAVFTEPMLCVFVCCMLKNEAISTTSQCNILCAMNLARALCTVWRNKVVMPVHHHGYGLCNMWRIAKLCRRRCRCTDDVSTFIMQHKRLCQPYMKSHITTCKYAMACRTIRSRFAFLQQPGSQPLLYLSLSLYATRSKLPKRKCAFIGMFPFRFCCLFCLFYLLVFSPQYIHLSLSFSLRHSLVALLCCLVFFLCRFSCGPPILLYVCYAPQLAAALMSRSLSLFLQNCASA